MVEERMEYHKKQFVEPKRSTVKFTEWLNEKIMKREGGGKNHSRYGLRSGR